MKIIRKFGENTYLQFNENEYGGTKEFNRFMFKAFIYIIIFVVVLYFLDMHIFPEPK